MPGILESTVASIPLRNPVLLAAGTAGTLDEMAGVLDLSRVGGVVTKSLTREPRDGNAPWRVVPCDHGGGVGGGMLNAIGLANVGIDRFLDDHAPRIPFVPAPVIASVAGFSIDDYAAVAASLDEVPALAAIELNVSCPNVHGGGEFSADPRLLRELMGVVRPLVKRLPLFVKLSPLACGALTIAEAARAAIEGDPRAAAGPSGRPGADALTIANTVPAMAIDVRTRRPRLGNVTGGLSGPAIHPIAVKLVYDAYKGICRATSTPIVGVGGVLTWEDAAEMILAGASAVQMGTALFADPRSPLRVVRGLERWARAQGVPTLATLIGAAHP